MRVTGGISTQLLSIVAALMLLAAACGGSNDTADVESAVQAALDDALEDAGIASDAADDAIAQALEDAGASGGDAAEAIQEAMEDVEDMVDAQEAAQAAVGGGVFMLTVGDQSWTFDQVRCAFGEEEIGQEGAEFVLSSIQNGLQAYVSIDSFGDFVSVDDISDFENPSVGLSAGNATISIDGKNVSGTADFMDSTSDSFETTAGTFSGTCP